MVSGCKDIGIIKYQSFVAKTQFFSKVTNDTNLCPVQCFLFSNFFLFCIYLCMAEEWCIPPVYSHMIPPPLNEGRKANHTNISSLPHSLHFLVRATSKSLTFQYYSFKCPTLPVRNIFFKYFYFADRLVAVESQEMGLSWTDLPRAMRTVKPMDTFLRLGAPTPIIEWWVVL